MIKHNCYEGYVKALSGDAWNDATEEERLAIAYGDEEVAWEVGLAAVLRYVLDNEDWGNDAAKEIVGHLFDKYLITPEAMAQKVWDDHDGKITLNPDGDFVSSQHPNCVDGVLEEFSTEFW